MPSAARTLAIDKVEDRTPRICTNCGKPKSRERDFSPQPSAKDGLHSWCRRCNRIARHEYYHEGGGREAMAAYQARPEVKERERQRLLAWRKAHPGAYHRYQRSPRGKLMRARRDARRALATAEDDARRARLEAVIAACDRELAREENLPVEQTQPRALTGPSKPRSRAAYGSRSVARGIHVTREGTYKVKVSDGKGSAIQGGTFKMLDEARAVANALGRRILGIDGYADMPARGKRS
jgi:hypothetical protein